MNEWPKAVTTASIWISIGFSLGFGLFRMNFSGGHAAALLFTLTGMILAVGIIVTAIVWRTRPPQATHSDRHP